MGEPIPFPRKVLEPLRLEGQADRFVHRNMRRLLTTQESLHAVVDLRKIEDSQELKSYEQVLLRKLDTEQAYVEAIERAFKTAEWLAPTILRETAAGDRAVILVFQQRQPKQADLGLTASFDCTSKGSVLVAHQMSVLAPSSRQLRR